MDIMIQPRGSLPMPSDSTPPPPQHAQESPLSPERLEFGLLSPRMFHRERSIPLRGSAAALCNNLSVLQLPVRNLTHFGVVHGPSAQLLSAAPEGVPLAQRQLHAKQGAGVSPPLITQVSHGPGSDVAERSPNPVALQTSRNRPSLTL